MRKNGENCKKIGTIFFGRMSFEIFCFRGIMKSIKGVEESKSLCFLLTIPSNYLNKGEEKKK